MQRANSLSIYNIQTNKRTVNQLMWSTDMYEDEYFEVEILTDRTGPDCLEEKNIDAILNSNKYKCHICNIDVPKTYAKEHNNSTKHKTCKEITNIALERTRQQLQLDVAVSRKVEVNDTYFCEPCAAVVFNSDKENHKATKLHKISVKHDKLLSELLKVYEDIENIDSEVDELEVVKQMIKQDTFQTKEADLKGKVVSAGNVNGNSETDTSKLLNNLHAIEEKNLLKVGALVTNTGMFNVDLKNIEKEDHTKGIEQEVIHFGNSFDCSFGPKFLEKNNRTEINTSQEKSVVQKKIEESKTKGVEDAINLQKETLDELNNINDSESKCEVFAVTAKTIDNQAGVIKNSKRKIKGFRKLSVGKEIEVKFASEVDKLNKPDQKSNRSDDVKLEERPINDIFSQGEQAIANMVDTYDRIAERIEAVISKYFNSNFTVDALNNNSEEAHNKNKIGNKENIQHRHKANSPQPVSIVQDKQTDNKNEKTNSNIKEVETLNNKAKNNNIVTEEKFIKKSNNPEKNKEEPERKKHAKQNKEKNKKLDKQVIEKKTSKPVKSNAPSFNLLCYIKDISRRCEIKPIHTVKAMTDHIVQITAINKDKFKVHVNNFHSFHTKSNKIYCKICEDPNVRRQEWHIAENQHREKVMTPIKDLNGIRELDDIWSHCILCNDLTKNVDFHLQSLHHMNKIKQTLVELGQDSDEDTKTEHKTKPTKKNAAITNLMAENNLAMTSKGNLHCSVCDLMVDYDLTSVKQHINCFNHLDGFEIKAAENNIIFIDGDMYYYCTACNVHLSKINVIPHCNSKAHQNLLEEYFNKPNDAERDEIVILSSISQNVKKSKDKMVNSELICFVCNIYIQSIDVHTATFDHMKNYLSYLESNKLNEIESDTFYCIPCNAGIGIDFLMSHCMSKKHKRVLKCFLCSRNGHTIGCYSCQKQDHQGSIDCNVCNKNEDDNCNEKEHDIETASRSIEKYNIAMPLKVLYQFQTLKYSDNLLCTVCDEEVPYTRKQASYHVSTVDHIVAFNLMMLWNKIKKRADRYFCDICRSDITYFSEIDHVLGKEHAVNLARQPKGTVYEYDSALVTHAFAMSHKVGDRVRLSPVVSIKTLS